MGSRPLFPSSVKFPPYAPLLSYYLPLLQWSSVCLNLESLDEDRRSSLQNNEAAKKWSKATFDRHVNLHSFNEGDLILAYDITHDTLGHGKFESLWHGPYIIQHCLTKGAYILASPEGHPLKEPINGLYLKKFYA
jgi:hypothetical protein